MRVYTVESPGAGAGAWVFARFSTFFNAPANPFFAPLTRPQPLPPEDATSSLVWSALLDLSRDATELTALQVLLRACQGL